MRKTIYVCDRCGAEQDLELIRLFPSAEDFEVCDECRDDIIEYAYRKKKPDELKTSDKIAKTSDKIAKTSEKIAPSKKPTAEPEKTTKSIDWGKAQALRNAGWTVTQIAEELKCSKQSVYTNTTPPAEDAKAKKPLEWSDHEPNITGSEYRKLIDRKPFKEPEEE